MPQFTPRLNIKLIQAVEQFIDESFNNVILDIDNKVVGIAHLTSGAHWEVWEKETNYEVNDVVRWVNMKSHQYAKCITSGSSGSVSPASNVTGSMVNDGTAVWLIKSLTDSDGSSGGISIWQGTKSYTRNDTVLYNSVLYRCKIGHISSASFANDISNWQEIFASVRLWKASELYLVNDTVIYDDNLYKCISQHTSNNQFALANWERICDKLYIEDWNSSTPYELNQLVDIDGIVYRCISAHTSGNNLSVDSVRWSPVCANIATWGANKFYNESVVVKHNGILYLCVIAHVSGNSFPALSSGYWIPLNSGESYINDWSASSDYYINSIVKYNGNLYRAIQTHDATAFSASNWELLTDSINVWSANSLYVVGQYVTNDNKLYRCITQNSDSTFNPAKWVKISGGGLETWEANKDYSVGDVVINAGKIYQCNTAHTSQSTFNADSEKWTEISACITRIPNWETSKDYVVGDLVAHDAKIYQPRP